MEMGGQLDALGEVAPVTHWMGPKTDLNGIEKRQFLTLPGRELRPLGRPARDQSLFRLPVEACNTDQPQWAVSQQNKSYALINSPSENDSGFDSQA
jgi:hypothetical protein